MAPRDWKMLQLQVHLLPGASGRALVRGLSSRKTHTRRKTHTHTHTHTHTREKATGREGLCVCSELISPAEIGKVRLTL